MSITTTTHLNFRGNARAALEFYKDAFGGELSALTYADAHNVTEPSEADQLMWGGVTAPSGFHIMAFDVPSHTEYEPGIRPVFVSVRSTDADELTASFGKLSDGAEIIVPLGQAAWSPLYGMLKDRFGVTWVMDLEVAWDNG